MNLAEREGGLLRVSTPLAMHVDYSYGRIMKCPYMGLYIRKLRINNLLHNLDDTIGFTLYQNYYKHLLTYSVEQNPSWEANWFCS